MPTDMCGQTRPWTPEEDQQHQTPQIKITISPSSVGKAYNIEYKSPCPYESYQMAARLASTKITHGKSSEIFSGDRDMHSHLEISGPNHPKGGVQYRNQGPIIRENAYKTGRCQCRPDAVPPPTTVYRRQAHTQAPFFIDLLHFLARVH